MGLKSLPKIFLEIAIHFFKGFVATVIIFPKYSILGIKSLVNKEKIRKKNHKKIVLPMVLSMCVYLICVFILSRWSVQQLKTNYLSKTIIEDTEKLIKEEVIEIPQENEGSSATTTPIEENTNQTSGGSNQTPEQSTSGNNTANNNAVNSNTTQSYYPNDYWDYIKVPFISVDFTNLLKKNPETVGWIKINNTNVNYPIVQTTNNNYYLNHSFNNSKNSSGWVYADYRVNFVDFDKNNIIYAHNLYNRTMFGSLVNTLKPSWYNNEDNRLIRISTPTSNSIWSIFSIYTIEPTIDYLKTNFEDTNYLEWLGTMKSRSIANFNIDLNESDKVLTLSTCDDSGTKRIVVQAKMVSINYR